MLLILFDLQDVQDFPAVVLVQLGVQKGVSFQQRLVLPAVLLPACHNMQGGRDTEIPADQLRPVRMGWLLPSIMTAR